MVECTFSEWGKMVFTSASVHQPAWNSMLRDLLFYMEFFIFHNMNHFNIEHMQSEHDDVLCVSFLSTMVAKSPWDT